MDGEELVVASPEEIGAGIELQGNGEPEHSLKKSPSIRAPVTEETDANGEHKEEKKNDVELKKQEKEAHGGDEVEDSGAALVPIRAPVSVEEGEDGDGNGSSGSGQSFDSALERMAGSSTASFDTAASPKAVHDESETARVMPKAMLSADDKHSSSTTSSSSSSSESDEDNENDEEGAASSISDNGVEDEQENFTDDSAQGFRVLGAETENVDGGNETKNDLPDEDNEEKDAAEGAEKDRTENVPELEERSGHSSETTPSEEAIQAVDGPSTVPTSEREDEEGTPQEVVTAKEEEPEAGSEGSRALGNESVSKEEAKPVQQEKANESPSHQKEIEKEVEKDVEKDAGKGLDNVEESSPGEAAQSESEKGPSNAEKISPGEDARNESEKGPSNVEEISPGEDARSESERGPAAEEANAAVEGHVEPEDSDEDEDDAEEDSELLPPLKSKHEVPESKTGFAPSNAPSLGSAGPSLPARPTGASRSLPSLESASRNVHAASHNPTSADHNPGDNPAQANGEPNDENNETREKLQNIRVKFLRLAHRLGQSAHNVVVAQVLYRLGLAEQLRGGRSSRNSAFSFERANAIAEELESSQEEQQELDFTCTIMVLGKSGVGKSATINSLFDEVKTETSAFNFATKKVQEITGTVHGIKLRVIDTPGLLPAVADQRHNERIMSSVKRFIKKSPPDIVLYFDRLDMQSRDYGDLPLLRTITDTFGAAIWFNAIVVLTHASTAPPDGPNGVPLSYEMFVAQRSHVVQQTIRQAAGDMRLMNPVSLVENHSACRTNRAGERVLPNGQIWKPQLLLLCFASKILAEANSLLKLQESTPGKPFGMRSKVPPLPFLLSSLLQSRTPLKMPDESMNDDEETDDDMDVEESDDEEDYDELPPFRRLTKEEIEQLDKKNRASYFEELRERERLFQKKQWKEELRRRKEMKKRASREEAYQAPLDDGYDDDDNGKSAAVPVPLPDMTLPPTFDSDNPTHRYRYLETANQWLVRPVLETHGWDHDSGYDGLNVEKVFVVANKIPASISGQVTKDKKEANVTMECAASMKHGEGKFTQLGFDMQTVGKDMSYTLRSETRFNNFRKNKTIAGLALTMLGDTLAGGMKLEDRMMIGKRLKVVLNGGALTGKGEVAYGGTMEISLRDKDFPIGRTLTTLGFSVMNWHGDLAVGGNLQSQFMVGRTMVVARSNLNNRGSGTITIKASSSEQLQMALVGIVPLVRAIIGHKLFSGSSSRQA